MKGMQVDLPVERSNPLWFWEICDERERRDRALDKIAEVAQLLQVMDWDKARSQRFALLDTVRVLTRL